MRLRMMGLLLAGGLMLTCGEGMAGAEGTAPAPGAAPPPTPVAVRPIEALTAADFARLPDVEGPELSPSGTRIAARIARGGTQYFAIVPVEADAKPRLVALGSVNLMWWRWVNDDWVVIGVGQLQNVYGQDIYVTRAIAVSADGTKLAPLAPMAAQNASDLLWVASDGSPRVLLSYQTSLMGNEEGFWAHVEEIDVSNRHRHTVQPSREQIMDWFADGAGTVRIGVMRRNEGRTTRILYRSRPGELMRTIDVARTPDDDLIRPQLFLPDGKTALMTSTDPEGFDAIYDLDLVTMKRGTKLYASKGYDIGGMMIDQNAGALLGVVLEEERASTRWIAPDLAAADRAIAAHVQGATARIVSWNKDHSRLVTRIGGPDAPGVYMLFEPAKDLIDRIGLVNAAIGMRRLNPVSTIRYKARDGLEIAAVLTLPKGKAAKDLPLIVLPHGGPFARDFEEWDWWVQFLATRGYAVIQPNYRGSSGYGTAFAKKGEGQWGLAMQDDLNDAVDALAARGIADPKRVCMVGASYGGYAAMRAAQRDGARYRCAVSYAGVSDLGGMLRYDRQFLNAGAGVDWLKRQAPDLSAVSPLAHPEQVSIPLLLVHGAKDQRVPVGQSRQLAARLKAAGKPVTYIEQPLADHHFSREQDRLQFLKAMELFLKAHNPA